MSCNSPVELPLFVFADGKLLSRSRFIDWLRKEAGIDPTILIAVTVFELEQQQRQLRSRGVARI